MVWMEFTTGYPQSSLRVTLWERKETILNYFFSSSTAALDEASVTIFLQVVLWRLLLTAKPSALKQQAIIQKENIRVLYWAVQNQIV
jgi:hypothetical protein